MTLFSVYKDGSIEKDGSVGKDGRVGKDGSIDKHDEVDGALRTLAGATAGRHLAAHERVVAASDSRSTSEGLALLGAYVSIADPRTRQAVLDVVMTVARGAERV